MKRKILLVFSFNLLLCFYTYSQVGFLSSNNKSDDSKSSVEPSLPTLTLTKDVGDYKKASDTLNIQLHFNNSALESVDSTRRYLNANNNVMSNTDFRIESASLEDNRIKRILALTKKNLDGEKVASERKILIQKINDLNNKLESNKAIIENLIKAQEDLKDKNDSAIIILGKQTLQIQSANTLNRSLLSELTNIKYKTFYNNISLLNATSQTKMSDIYKNQYAINSYWFLIDSTKENFDKSKFLDSLATVYSQIRIQTDINSELKKHINDAQAKLENTRRLAETQIISSPDDYKPIDEQWIALKSDTLRISQQLSELGSDMEKTITFYKSILRHNIKDKQPQKKDAENKEFGAFPQLTTILGKREVIPQLQLYGSYSHQNITKSFEANLGLSFAPTNTPDTANLYTIFLPTASKFLINSNFTWSFLPVGMKDDSTTKKIGLKIDVSFASKNLVYDTSKIIKAITSSLLYAKAGIEFGVIPKRLSIYGNINTATLMDKVDEFRTGTSINSKFFSYIDCGAKLYMDPTRSAKVDDGLFIYSNLNFVINSGDVRRITKTNDTVIPSIQLGIVKSLGKF